MIFDKSCAAFAGTPMGDFLGVISRAGLKKVSEAIKFILENEKLPSCIHGCKLMDWNFNVLAPPCNCKLAEEKEECCRDPEVCVDSVCIVHPECGRNRTTRTTPPNEEGVSEFWCFDCREYFTAEN